MNDEKYQKLVSSVSESDLFFKIHLKKTETIKLKKMTKKWPMGHNRTFKISINGHLTKESNSISFDLCK